VLRGFVNSAANFASSSANKGRQNLPFGLVRFLGQLLAIVLNVALAANLSIAECSFEGRAGEA
jgi:hypothetical protein